MGLPLSDRRSWLDTTPVAALVALSRKAMRDATGRAEPLEALRPARPTALGRRRRIGFWSLVGGVGASTVAALVAHRSAAAGRPPLLVDVDRWAPSLGLRARMEAATLGEVLLQPGRELDLVSRWGEVRFLPSAPSLHAVFDADRVSAAIDRAAGDGPVVLDLGTGADALDRRILAPLDLLCVVAGTRLSQLQAAFCAAGVLGDLPCRLGLVVNGGSAADAESVARRLPWPLLAAVPFDPFLGEDRFAVRASTLRAIDALIRSCA